jgi:hypothetical protein
MDIDALIREHVGCGELPRLTGPDFKLLSKALHIAQSLAADADFENHPAEGNVEYVRGQAELIVDLFADMDMNTHRDLIMELIAPYSSNQLVG